MFQALKDWEGSYEINRAGVIRSLPRNGNGYKILELKYCLDRYGYPIVTLRRNGKRQQFKVHRLVAKQFIPNPENKPQVNHIDGDKTNFKINNLEWVTVSENIKHAKATGLQCECPNRVPVAQISKTTGEIINTFSSLKEAEDKTGVGWTGISANIRGKRKSAGGYVWRRIGGDAI